MKCPKCKTGTLYIEEHGWRIHEDLKYVGKTLVITQQYPAKFVEDESGDITLQCSECDYSKDPEIEWR